MKKGKKKDWTSFTASVISTREKEQIQPTNQPTADIVVWLENIEQVSDA